MDVIRLGICIDNVDPKGIGRIRYNEVGGSKELDPKFEKWGKDDKFTAIPFLPTNINFIPEIGQAVKIIAYNNESEFINQEYIAGPFTTTHNFNSQNYEQQIEHLTYGSSVEHSPDLIKKDGTLIDKKDEGSIPKYNDFGISGKYGSDLLFTDNGIQVRGGKFISKEIATPNESKKLLNHPTLSDNISKLTLKKFPSKMELKDEEVVTIDIKVDDLKYIVEYDFDDLDNPTVLNFYIYKVIPAYEGTFKTNAFTNNTLENLSEYPSLLKLINVDNTTTSPTFIITIPPDGNYISELRCTISDLELNGIEFFEPRIPNSRLHPFFVRPSILFKRKITPSTSDFLDKINVTGVVKGVGLFFSKGRPSPPVVSNVKTVKKLKIIDKRIEQSFGSVTSDKIYLLSSDTNISKGKSVDFKKLNRYEYTQDDFLEKIEPNTYSTVRGESLIEVLKGIVSLLFSHNHNINKTLTKSDANYVKLTEIIKTLENDILNKSIRIN